jgi:hypothetical protein
MFRQKEERFVAQLQPSVQIPQTDQYCRQPLPPMVPL